MTIGVGRPSSSMRSLAGTTGSVSAALMSQVSRHAEALERVLTLMVHRPAGTLRRASATKFGDDLGDRGGAAVDRLGDVLIAERAVTPSTPRKVQVDDGDLLPLDVAPHVDLPPGQQGVDADVRPLLRRRRELVPELRRLIPYVPAVAGGARAEHA